VFLLHNQREPRQEQKSNIGSTWHTSASSLLSPSYGLIAKECLLSMKEVSFLLTFEECLDLEKLDVIYITHTM
jgi:hypothetical protein